MDDQRPEERQHPEGRRPPADPAAFDAAYEGTPPWDIGRPQPALAELAEAGEWRGRVLDIGCGTGEHALLAASLGLDATGIDAAPNAIEIARRKAAERSLAVRFEVGDVLELGKVGQPFDTVVDSGLFHVFDDAQRRRYVESLATLVAPGGRCFVLCFSDRQPGDFGPRRVSEHELREAFAPGWRVDELADVRIFATFLPEGGFARRASVTRV